jgi:hypothetical protein
MWHHELEYFCTSNLLQIRELAHSCIRKAELLPEDESVEIHTQMKKEHADKIQTDKNAPYGLFKGYFGVARNLRARSASWTDASSFENECPVCFTPVDENGQCPECGETHLPMDYNNPFPMSLLFDPSEGAMSEITEDVYTDPDWEDRPDEDDEFDEIDHIPEGYEFDGPLPADFSDAGTGTHFEIFQRLRAGGFNPIPLANRRRSYSSSIPDYQESEMGTVEEEDEVDEDDGDSVMTGSNDGQSLEHDTSSDMSNLSTEPTESGDSIYSSARSTPAVITPGASSRDPSTSRRRRRADSNTPTPSMTQPSRRRRLRGPSQSTSSSRNSSQASSSNRRGRDTRQETWPEMILRQMGPVPVDRSWDFSDVSQQSLDGDGENGDDSDGGRTTVEWDPNTNSNIRSRTGGSLTPTADQPYPVVRPRNSRVQLNPRGLRRRTSVLSNTPSHYEENDADDDGSDDTDVSNRTPRRGQRANSRQLSVDPHIQSLFAGIIQLSSDTNHHGNHADYLRNFSNTPLNRPRTSNRNRSTTPAGQQNMTGPSSRPGMNTPNNRHVLHSAFGGQNSDSQHPTYVGQSSFYPIPSSMASYADSIGRPESRVSHRPPSASGRRNSGQYNPSRSNNRNNPFIRTRQSNRTLREQSSTATLRPASSRRTLRGQSSRVSIRGSAQSSPQSNRSQSRQQQRVAVNDTPSPIRHSLNHTPSVMHLPQSVGQGTQLPSSFRSPSQSHVGQLRDMRSIPGQGNPARGTSNDTMQRVQQLINERRAALATRGQASGGRNENETSHWRSGQLAQSSGPSNPFARGFTASQTLSQLRGHPPPIMSASSAGTQRLPSHGVRSPLNPSLTLTSSSMSNTSSPSQNRHSNVGSTAGFMPASSIDDRDRTMQYVSQAQRGRGARGQSFGGSTRHG